jgi:hypothetical protein
VAAAEAKLEVLQHQIDTATEQLYAGERAAMDKTVGDSGSSDLACRVRKVALELWQGQGRHPDLEEHLAELCLLLTGSDGDAYVAAQQGFLQPLLGHFSPTAALVDAGLEVVLSLVGGAKSRHAAIAAGLSADLEKDDDTVAKGLCSLFAPLRVLVAEGVAPVPTRVLAAKTLLAMAQMVQSTPGNVGMAPIDKALWATSHAIDSCFDCRLGAVVFVDQPEETKASKKKKLKDPPLVLDAMMPLVSSAETWLSDTATDFVNLLAELPCPSAWYVSCTHSVAC